MLPKPRGCPPKIHCDVAVLQNNPSLTSIPSVTSFLKAVSLSVREMMKLITRSQESHQLHKKSEESEAEDSGENMDMQRVIGMSLMSRIFLRDWLRWQCRMQKNLLKILAQPKTRENNMKTPFLSSFCLPLLRCSKWRSWSDGSNNKGSPKRGKPQIFLGWECKLLTLHDTNRNRIQVHMKWKKEGVEGGAKKIRRDSARGIVCEYQAGRILRCFLQSGKQSLNQRKCKNVNDARWNECLTKWEVIGMFSW